MMKRGLSTRDAERVTSALLRARQEPIRDELRRRGLDAAVLSCDISSGGDIAYLTHLTLYWSTALLVIGADGATVFLPALSPRTESWFAATGEFDEVRSGTDLIGSLRATADAHGYRRLGLIERDRFPRGLLREIESGEGFETEDLGDIVRRLRAVPDEIGLADQRATSDLLTAAFARFDEVVAAGAGATEAAADAEHILRMSGAWDATVGTTATGESLHVRMTCQLRDAWAAAERRSGGASASASWESALRDVILDRIRPGRTAADLHADVLAHAAAHPLDGAAVWETLLEPTADIEKRPAILPPAALAGGMTAHVSVSAWGEDGGLLMRWGNTVLITEGERARCLISEG